jgi:3-deoxy-D-manno-octulosonic-acid transferase
MIGSPLRRMAPRISFAACRTEDDAERFRELGLPASAVAVVGDMKFDKLAAPLDGVEREELKRSLGFPTDAPVVVFGSVRPKEEGAVASAAAAVAAALPGARFVVAPRHLERVPAAVSAFESRGLATALRSGGEAGGAPAVVINTTGELARVYAAGSLAFVGGTLAPYGGHDPLEPAAQGVPVLVGPHTETCRDAARRLVAAGAAFEVPDGPALGRELVRLLGDEAARAEAGARALDTIADGQGATARTLEFLEANGVIDAGA